MIKFLTIIIFLLLIKNTELISFKSKSSEVSFIKKSVHNFFSPFIINQHQKAYDLITNWKKDSFFRGANVHPYKHFSPFSMRDKITENDLIELKKLGANLVVANYPGVFSYFPPYEIDSLNLKNLDEIVRLTKKLRFNLIIALRSGPGRSLYSFFDKYREDEFLFYDTTSQEKYIEMCKFIATRYKDFNHLVGINFILEPHADDPVNLNPIDDSVYFNFMERLIFEVRKVNNKLPIVVQPQSWAYPEKFLTMKKFDDEKIIYSFNMYFPHKFTNEKNDSTYPGFYFHHDTLVYVDSTYLENFLRPVIDFKAKYNVPIFVNEYGGILTKQGILLYLRDLNRIFLKHGFHFAFYVWKSGWGETNGEKFDDFSLDKENIVGDTTNKEKQKNKNSLLEEFKQTWKFKR